MEKIRKICVQRLRALYLLMVLFLVNSPAKASIYPDTETWYRLFFQTPAVTEISGSVYSINLDKTNISAVVSFYGKKPVFLTLGNKIKPMDEELSVISIAAENIYFENADGVSFSLKVPNDHNADVGNQHSKLKRQQRVGSSFSSARKANAASNALAHQSHMFNMAKTPKDQIIALAVDAGVPAQFAHLISENIEPARSRGGRPGWLVNAVPSLLEKFGVNIQRGDILLAVDGISAQNLAQIQNHISDRNLDQIFEVEVQRNGRLFMLEFSE